MMTRWAARPSSPNRAIFCPIGDGICVGRDDGSPASPSYDPPFRLTGATIDKVVVDVSGQRYVDHEAEVRGWFAID
jgi:arylsulfatase